MTHPGAALWHRLAKETRAWAEHLGSQGKDTSAHERKARLYERTARSLEMRAEEA